MWCTLIILHRNAFQGFIQDFELVGGGGGGGGGGRDRMVAG